MYAKLVSVVHSFKCYFTTQSGRNCLRTEFQVFDGYSVIFLKPPLTGHWALIFFYDKECYSTHGCIVASTSSFSAPFWWTQRKEHGSGARHPSSVLLLPLSGCGTPGNSLCFSQLQSLSVEQGSCCASPAAMRTTLGSA